MSIFKRGIGHSKSFDLDEKIKILDSELKKTDVVVNDDDRNFLYEQQGKKEEVEKYNWRDGLVENNNVENIREEYVATEYRKKNNIKRVDSYISSVNEDFENLKTEIFNEISENFLFNIPAVENKINRVLEIYDEIKEGLLNEPPNIKNKDPLTPLDQNFVTVDELNKHYSLFINRIQEQIATIGGGGETRLKYLDDIVGIATNPSAYDNKYLKYDHSLQKFVFETSFAAGLQGAQGLQGTQGLQGLQGLQGIQGTQGFQGLQGTQGLLGTQGSQGISNQGVQGTQGVQGLQGLSNQGVQGVQGTTSSFGSRLVVSNTTASIGAGTTVDLDITGYKSYSLLKVGISSAAWVVVYSDSTSRTNDSTRSYLTDPTPGTGIIAEVRTTSAGISTFLITPGIVGWNNNNPVNSTIYARVTNNESSSSAITVDLTVVKLEE